MRKKITYLFLSLLGTLINAQGPAVTSWLQAGRPKDFSKFKDIYAQAVDEVKKNVDKFKNDPHKDEPLGDESKKFTK